jgi:hypothetical protein
MTYTDETIPTVLPGITRPALLKAVRSGALRGNKVGRRWYFMEEDVVAFIRGSQAAEKHAESIKAVRVSRQSRKSCFTQLASQEDHFAGRA